jgi:hypothetical protein
MTAVQLLTCFSLAFPSGNFGPVVSAFPVRKAGGVLAARVRVQTCQI